MILAVITQSTLALIVNPIKRTCSFVMWAPHTLNHGHATHFHNYKSPHTLTFAQTAQTPKTTLNNLQLKTLLALLCIYLSVCVCVCAAPTMSVCFSLNGFLWRRQGRGEKDGEVSEGARQRRKKWGELWEFTATR